MLLGAPLGRIGMNPLPVQGFKIHEPPLRHDTLSRTRLNSWLDTAAVGRLALVIAEAGFGKTTFLADWAAQSSRSTAWYRLEPDDRDWLAFVRHLVATGREIDPAFAPITYELLLSLGPGGPTRDDLVSSVIRETSAFAETQADGFSLLFDDYHSVDGSPETDPIVQALVDSTGSSFSVVIASRATPASLSLARLRAKGAVSRIDGDDLSFTVEETEQLFRDAYRLPLEPDVITDLVHRTQGWAALLSLVHASLEGRPTSEARKLVRGLRGSSGELFDYLSDEVLVHVSPRLADFMADCAILEELTPALAAMATGRSTDDCAELMSSAEARGFLSREGSEDTYRFSPLMRDYLYARLVDRLGTARVMASHLALAESVAASDWRVASYHYRVAGRPDLAAGVIHDSVGEVLGSGRYRAAADLLAGTSMDSVVAEILRSRLLLQLGDGVEAGEAAENAISVAERDSSRFVSVALQNASAIALGAHRYQRALDYAVRAANASIDPWQRELAEAHAAILTASGTGSLPSLVQRLERLLALQDMRGLSHHAAITSLNLAQILVWLDRSEDALRYANRADELLGRSSQGYEVVSIRLAQAQAEAHLGHWEAGSRAIDSALHTAHPDGEAEAVLEAAILAMWFGPAGDPARTLGRVRRDALPDDWASHWRIVDLWIEQDPQVRDALLEDLSGEPPLSLEPAAAFRWFLTRARAHLQASRRAPYEVDLQRAESIADSQRSPVARRLCTLLRAVEQGGRVLGAALEACAPTEDPLVGVFANEICGQLNSVTGNAIATVTRAATQSPARWRDPLRSAVRDGGPDGADAAAALLEQLGELDDIQLLREYGRRRRRSGRPWGEALGRRLAPRVVVEDLGHLWVDIGGTRIDGRTIRRKALALLAFLICQPGASATPDQVIEALWPDLDPDQGVNSVHQTIYFLRRVLDSGYRAGLSPDYIRFESDVVSLDRDLVSCRSWACIDLLSRRPLTRLTVEGVISVYQGRFALDFPYEDWATNYRDHLHARFLAEVERGVAGQLPGADDRWRLWIGQQALLADPEADDIEAHVIGLYRRLGAHAAAAEQYAHYASTLRDQLGVEPPAFGDL